MKTDTTRTTRRHARPARKPAHRQSRRPSPPAPEPATRPTRALRKKKQWPAKHLCLPLHIRCSLLYSEHSPSAPPLMDRAAGARTRLPENSKRAYFRAPVLPTPPKFHESTPREKKKKENCGNFGPPFGAPPFWAPPFWAPPFVAPPCERTTLCRPKIQHPKIGRNRIGRSRNWPKSKLAEVDRARGGRRRHDSR